MNKLHLLRSKPDHVTEKLMTAVSGDNCGRHIRLYDEDLNWEEVVEAIFSHDGVVCWW